MPRKMQANFRHCDNLSNQG